MHKGQQSCYYISTGTSFSIYISWTVTNTTAISYGHLFFTLPPFSLICDFGKQNPRGNVSKISVSLACLIDRSDQNPPITAR